MAISSARQRDAVSEGMALGLVMLDCNELPFDKLRVDLAFEHAWRDWPHEFKSQFPQVDTDLRQGTDAVWVMTHAERTKSSRVFFWEWNGGTLSICGRRHDWDSANPDDVKHAVDSIDGTVPLDGWKSLAGDFLADLRS